MSLHDKIYLHGPNNLNFLHGISELFLREGNVKISFPEAGITSASEPDRVNSGAECLSIILLGLRNPVCSHWLMLPLRAKGFLQALSVACS